MSTAPSNGAGDDQDNIAAIMRLTDDSWYHIAKWLSLRDLFKLALVSRRWRAVLLHSPDLWTSLPIAFGAHRHHWLLEEPPVRPERWVPVLSLVLERSGSLPLNLSLQIGDDYPNTESLQLAGVFDLLCDQMRRVRSLALTVPGWQLDGLTLDGGKAPPLLLERAPALERFQLFVTSQGVLLPKELFAYTAPKLKEVELMACMMPIEPCAAFRGVQSFTYEWPGGAGDPLDEIFIEDVIDGLPQLKRLTLVAERLDTGEFVCQKALDVRVGVRVPWDVYKSFPNAMAVCYSLYGSKPGPAGENLKTLLRAQTRKATAKRAAKEITSLDMRLTFTAVYSMFVRMAIKANNALVATDISWDELAPIIAQTVPLAKLEKLVLPELVWKHFSAAPMPRLNELTIFLRRRAFGWARDPWPLKDAGERWPAVTVLRLARILVFETNPRHPVDLEVSSTIDAGQLAEFIQAKFDYWALRKLVLHGWELANPSMNKLLMLIPDCEVVYEDEMACDDWEKTEPWTNRHKEYEGFQL